MHASTANRASPAPRFFAENDIAGKPEAVVEGPARVTGRDEDSNPERAAPVTGTGSAIAPPVQSVTIPGKPRKRPTVPTHPARISGVTLDGRRVSLAPNVDSLISALRVGGLYARPLPQFGHEPAANPITNHFTDTLQSYAFITQAGVFAPGLNADLYGTGYLDGGALTGVGSAVFNGWSMAVSGLIADGWLGTYLSFNVAEAANHLLSLGVQLQFWKDYIKLGGTFVNFDLSALTFYSAGVQAALNVSRETADLGAYDGPDAEELAALHGVDYARDGLRQVEIRRLANKTMGVRAGGGSLVIAGLGRLDHVRGRQTVYRTLVGTRQARDIVFDGKGLRHYFKTRFQALGWTREVIPIPKQNDPDALRDGDEIIQTRTRAWTGAVVGGNLAAFVGPQLFRRRDREITAHKLDENHVEVVFNPTRVRDDGIYAYSPFGPEADFGAGRATSYRHNFVFDISTRTGRESYQSTIQGELPLALQRHKPSTAEQQGELALKTRAAEQNARLPPGVKRAYAHYIRSTEKRTGLGLYWRVVPRVFLPQNWMNALAAHWVRVHEVQAITDGNVVDAADNRFRQRRSELFWYGTRSRETAAQRRHVIDDENKRTYLGLTLEATLYDGCLRRLAANREFVRRVNGLFDRNYGAFTRHGHKQQREVDVVRMFEPAEVDRLARYAKLWRGGAQPLSAAERSDTSALMARMQAANLEMGVPFHSMRKMLTHAADAQPGEARSEVVQKWVQNHGMRAFGAINRLLPDERNVRVSTSSTTYTNTLQRAARLELQYFEPLRATDSAKAVRARYDDVGLGLSRIARALDDLADDPLVGEQAPLVRAQLEAARAGLYALLRHAPQVGPPLLQKLADKPRHIRRHRDTPIRYALEDPRRWVRAADHLCRNQQNRPLPSQAEALLFRWQSTRHVARKLRHRLHWLRDPLVGLDQDERDARIAQNEAALRRLVGRHAHHPGSGGLLNVQTLDPATRCEIRAALTSHRVRGLAKSLRRVLTPC